MFVDGMRIQMERSECTPPVVRFRALECRDIPGPEEGVIPGSSTGSLIGTDIDMSSPPWGSFELRDIDICTKGISAPDGSNMNLDFELEDLLLESIPVLGKSRCITMYTMV